jgi:hypothetical protein
MSADSSVASDAARTVAKVTTTVGDRAVQAVKHPRIFASVSAKLKLFGTVGAAGAVSYVDRWIALVIVIALALAAVMALMVFIAAIHGKPQKRDNVFRLLRWLRDRPEPPAPQ